MLFRSETRPTGSLSIQHIIPAPRTATPAEELSTKDLIRFASPSKSMPKIVNDYRRQNRRNFLRGLKAVATARALKLPTFYGRLSLVHIAKDGSWVDYGLVGMRVVTDNGVAFIVDAFQNTVELENMKYHGIGTTNTAENQTDSALAAEITTQYNPDNTRATGTTVEGAAANIYRTVGTNTVDASVGAVEHGVLDQAATGGGTLLDRTVFTIVNLANGDSLQSTYELTVTAGG